MQPLSMSVTLHHACHARAQNMGFKARDLLKLIPNLQISFIERCSGHGGSFGVKKHSHDIAMLVGKPVFSQTSKNMEASKNKNIVNVASSECPLAADHIAQGVQVNHNNKVETKHPVELLATAYNLKY